jgi:hypothetical protein
VCKITLYSGLPVKGNKQGLGVKQLNWRNNYKIKTNRSNVITDTYNALTITLVNKEILSPPWEELRVIYIYMTLMKPNMATKMLLPPTTFKQESFKVKTYIFN